MNKTTNFTCARQSQGGTSTYLNPASDSSIRLISWSLNPSLDSNQSLQLPCLTKQAVVSLFSRGCNGNITGATHGGTVLYVQVSL